MPSDAYILGTGLTPFGDLGPAGTLELMSRAAQAALDDAGLTRDAVDGLLVGYSTTFPHLMLSTAFAEHFGLQPHYAHGMQLGGATGLAMVAAARHLVAAGAARNLLVVAGENRRSGQTPDQTISTLAQVGDPAHEVPNGGTVPAYYALVASRYLAATGCSEADLAELVVLMRRHAAGYPGAHYPTPVTQEEVLASRPIATPLKRLDCCPISDGAAALLVSADPPAAAPRIAIAGTGQAHTHQSLMHAPDELGAGAAAAAGRAFSQAGRKPADMQLLGIYDSFSVTLALLLEACGFAPPGGAGATARAGHFALDGAQPLNPHGGLLAYGHCGVAGGLAHGVEAARQLAGRSPVQIAPAPTCAYVHADGGVLSSHVGLVLERRA
jgi:acetyl-CoA acetyltransferase